MRLILILIILSFNQTAWSTDFDCIARVVYAEARGEPLIGQLLVVSTIYNRATFRKRDVCSVTNRYRQYVKAESVPESFKTSLRISIEHFYSIIPFQPTHFYSGNSKPFWAHKLKFLGEYGNHKFYTEVT